MSELEEKARRRREQIDASRDLVLSTARFLAAYLGDDIAEVRERVQALLARGVHSFLSSIRIKVKNGFGRGVAALFRCCWARL